MNPATPHPTRVPYHSATAVFAAGKDSPRDFLERCLGQVSALEPRVGAFVALNIEGARKAADRATARWREGRPLSPIDGMPVGIKDIIETEDMPTEQGSPIFAGYRTGRDGASVAALREAGAVVVGKTVTTEFAASEPRGTRNPWDLDRTPGGSSSGSAAAVAVGMLPVGLGTQVVGSILRPSSFCGVYGFKPSVGGVNRGGSYDGLSQSCHGALAASLADAWLTVREISARVGGDPGYPGVSGPRELPAARRPARLALVGDGGLARGRACGEGRARAGGRPAQGSGDRDADPPRQRARRRRRAGDRRRDGPDAHHQQLGRALADQCLSRPARIEPGDDRAARHRRGDEPRRVPAPHRRARPRARRVRRAQIGVRRRHRLAGDRPGAARSALDREPGLCGARLAPRRAGAVATAAQAEGLPLGLQVLGFEQADASAVGLARWIDEILTPA